MQKVFPRITLIFTRPPYPTLKNPVQCKPLNVITANVIIRLMWSFFLRPPKLNWFFHSELTKVSVRLTLSVYAYPKVITLNGFHCISKLWYVIASLDNFKKFNFSILKLRRTTHYIWVSWVLTRFSFWKLFL
jgi:hypothetical protein